MSNIPKTIHYCWFGKGELPKLGRRCIDSWNEICSDYEIIEWNEDNFDINSNPYVQDAYKAKKYAFVSDYVRLYALYNHGGIYMDIDVEVIKSLDPYLEHRAFSGFQSPQEVPTGIIGSEKNNEVILKLLKYYDNARFTDCKGNIDTTTNVTIITKKLLEEGLVLNNTFQILNNNFAMYPNDYFCPLDYTTNKITLTDNTVTIHHFAGSWLSSSDKLKYKIRSILGYRLYNYMKKIIKLFKLKTISQR